MDTSYFFFEKLHTIPKNNIINLIELILLTSETLELYRVSEAIAKRISIK